MNLTSHWKDPFSRIKWVATSEFLLQAMSYKPGKTYITIYAFHVFRNMTKCDPMVWVLLCGFYHDKTVNLSYTYLNWWPCVAWWLRAAIVGPQWMMGGIALPCTTAALGGTHEFKFKWYYPPCNNKMENEVIGSKPTGCMCNLAIKRKSG